MKKAILVVDFQKEMKYSDDFVNRLKSWLEKGSALEKVDDIIQVMYINKEDSVPYQATINTDLNSLYVQTETIFTKHGYALDDSTVKIIQNEYKDIYICGGYLETCVLTCAIQLNSKNTRVHLISDMTFCDNKELKCSAMNILDWNLSGRIIFSYQI